MIRMTVMKKLLSLLFAVLMLAALLPACSDEDVLTYKYNYDLSEYIKLGDYKGIPANGYAFNITDEQIEMQILGARAHYARAHVVTARGAVNGDTVTLNCIATVDGVKIESESKSGTAITLGNGTLHQAVEEALIGVYADTHLTVDATLADEYEKDPTLAGKNVRYEIDVLKVEEQELPEYTEDFVRAYLGFESKEAYEQSIREGLEARYKKSYYTAVIAQVWPTLVENTEVIQYPEQELLALYNDIVASNKALAESQGVVFSDYIEAISGMTEEEFYTYARTTAESRIKEEMITYAIARAENLSISEEEYTTRATKYATEIYGLSSLEAFESVYDKGVIRHGILQDLVRELVADHAKLTYLEDPQ